MAYKYRLEAVITVRRNKEEQAQYKLADDIRLLDDHRRQLDAAVSSRGELVLAFEEKKKTAITSGVYSFYVEGLQGIDRQLELLNQAIQRQQQVVEDSREQLAIRAQEKSIVLKMKEKDYRSYLDDLNKKEQNENDEMAVLRHGRGHGQ